MTGKRGKLRTLLIVVFSLFTAFSLLFMMKVALSTKIFENASNLDVSSNANPEIKISNFIPSNASSNFPSVTQETSTMSFDRILDCSRCGQHKAPPLTDVNMTVSASLNGQQENELEYIHEQDNDGEENEQNGLFR
jgi:hypothetical protein